MCAAAAVASFVAREDIGSIVIAEEAWRKKLDGDRITQIKGSGLRGGH